MQPQIIVDRLLAHADKLTRAIGHTDEAGVAASLEAERELVLQAARCLDRLNAGWRFWRRWRIRVPERAYPPTES